MSLQNTLGLSLTLLSTGLGAAAPAAQLRTGIDEEAGLPYWELADEGMSLRLVQRLPDQSRAYFLARGFAAEHAERIARSCVFQTVFENRSHSSSPGVLRYDLDEWTIRHAGERRTLLTRERWAPVWDRLEVPRAAAIAFEWSLLPTVQSYRPGDYNWGMTLFGLEPGARFDLTVVWHQHDERHAAVIEGIECAPDIHPDPQELRP